MGKRGNEETPESGAISSFPHLPVSLFPRFPISPFPHFLISSFPLLVAAFLRLQGLSWGLPCARHWFSYHPDESLVLRAAANVNLFAGHLDPGFYNYGSFLIYCVSVVTQILDSWSPLKTLPSEMARMTLVGRWEVAFFGIATVYVVYLIGNRIAGRRAGFLAATIMAVLPMHAVHSHFVTVDVPATFWVAVALYNALRYPEGRRAALWCGIAAGIAAGTKYNAALVLLAGWAAIALSRGADRRGAGLRASEAFVAGKGRRIADWVIMTAATVTAFLITTPGILIAQSAFLRDFGYEANHVRTGHGLVFVNTGPGWWYHLSTNLWQGIGAFLLLAVVIAFGVYAASPRRPLFPSYVHRSSFIVHRFGPLAAFALPYFALISLAAVRFQRYDMPLLPVLAVAAGCLFARLRGRWLALPAAAIVATFVLAQGAVSTMSSPGGDLLETGQPFRGDPRDAVNDWFVRMAPPGATIGLTREPWFFSPPFSAANGGPQTVGMFRRETGRRFNLQILGPNDSDFSPRPDFVVISDYEYGDALRLQGVPVPERAAHFRRVPLKEGVPEEAARITRLWNTLVTDYELVGVWSPRQTALGISWPKRTLPPHDSFYSYPTIIVFRRATMPPQH
ncbi:MAG TPA: glycosyltransferase family 39 protein [Armatimonadota bacterium]